LNIDRFWVWQPFLLYSSLGMACVVLMGLIRSQRRGGVMGSCVIAGLIVAQLVTLLCQNPLYRGWLGSNVVGPFVLNPQARWEVPQSWWWRVNRSNPVSQGAFVGLGYPNPYAEALLSPTPPIDEHGGLTYRQCFAEVLMNTVRMTMEQPVTAYRVLSLGFPPAVAQKAGFHTVDGYSIYYPKAYKTAFSGIFTAALNDCPLCQGNFHQWGNQCYVLLPVHPPTPYRMEYEGMAPVRQRQRQPVALRLHTEGLQSLNVRYVMSSLPLDLAPRDSDLQFVKRFTHPDAAFEVFLYRVPSSPPPSPPLRRLPS
jgi:hypothetical protein